MSVQLQGRPVRAGHAHGSLVIDEGSGPGRIKVCERLEPYLADTGCEFAGLVGGTVPAPGGGPLPPGPPAIGAIDLALLLAGDVVDLDGSAGTLGIRQVTSVEVVTAFLQREDDRILLLRRSNRVGSFQGRWAGVSGYLEEATPERQAIREVGEETGIPAGRLSLVRDGAPVYARSADRLYKVHPFRFRVTDVEVRLDWEHTEMEWVDPVEIGRRPTVPRLDRAWAAVRESPGSGGAAGPGKR